MPMMHAVKNFARHLSDFLCAILYDTLAFCDGIFGIAGLNEYKRLAPTRPLGEGNKHIDLIVVAFNNPKFIEEQERLVRKYMTDPDYTYIVVDNSTNATARSTIRSFCHEHSIPYINIPRCIRISNVSRFTGPSTSHALALNIVYRHLIKKRKPYAFGLIDHDIFPLKPFSVLDKIAHQPFYGVKRERRRTHAATGSPIGGWFMWPGYSFYKYAEIAPKKINFLPTILDGIFLDTGGLNYLRLYRSYDTSTMQFANEKVIRVRQSEGAKGKFDIYQTDCITMIDDKEWIHLVNGSNYHKSASKANKAEMLEDLMERIRKKTED